MGILVKAQPGTLHLWKIFEHIMRTENRNNEGECYQINEKVKAIYSDKEHKLVSLSVNGAAVDKTKFYTICMQGYHFNNCKDYLNITQEELLASGKSKVVTTSAQQVLEEWLSNNQNVGRKVEGGWFITALPKPRFLKTEM